MGGGFLDSVSLAGDPSPLVSACVAPTVSFGTAPLAQAGAYIAAQGGLEATPSNTPNH